MYEIVAGAGMDWIRHMAGCWEDRYVDWVEAHRAEYSLVGAGLVLSGHFGVEVPSLCYDRILSWRRNNVR